MRLSTRVFSPLRLRKANSPGVLWFSFVGVVLSCMHIKTESNASSAVQQTTHSPWTQTVQHVIKHRQHNTTGEVKHTASCIMESILQFPSIISMFKANAAWWVRRDSNPTPSHFCLTFTVTIFTFSDYSKIRQAKWGRRPRWLPMSHFEGWLDLQSRWR